MIEESTNNSVTLLGVIASELKFSHEVYSEGFYDFTLSVRRLSGQIDMIPITISERIIQEKWVLQGNTVCLIGQFRSYNKLEENKSRLMLTVFAREIKLVDEEQEHINEIVLQGYICRQPIYRVTPFKREICDVLIAVNRAYNKSDYIPCIAWGRNARFVNNATIGDKVSLVGRIQSREYQKCYENGEVAIKTAYEVSVSRMEVNAGTPEWEYEADNNIID